MKREPRWKKNVLMQNVTNSWPKLMALAEVLAPAWRTCHFSLFPACPCTDSQSATVLPWVRGPYLPTFTDVSGSSSSSLTCTLLTLLHTAVIFCPSPPSRGKDDGWESLTRGGERLWMDCYGYWQKPSGLASCLCHLNGNLGSSRDGTC